MKRPHPEARCDAKTVILPDGPQSKGAALAARVLGLSQRMATMDCRADTPPSRGESPQLASGQLEVGMPDEVLDAEIQAIFKV